MKYVPPPPFDWALQFGDDGPLFSLRPEDPRQSGILGQTLDLSNCPEMESNDALASSKRK